MTLLLLKICFWLATTVVAYTFFVYPLAVTVAARLWPKVLDRSGPVPDGVSIVISARNEQSNIGRRLREFTEMLAARQQPGEVILISDGSTDDTVAIARTFTDRNVRVIDWQQNRGKAAALNYGVSLAKNDIVIFADARQRWSADAVEQLLESFRDPTVGAVSGELVLETESGVLAGIGLYWKFEKWLRSQESRLHSQIGVTGAICAVRRELFRSIPEGILLDDVYWPMHVAMNGRRVVYQPLAKAYDRLPDQSSDEMRRKLRTLVGNFQLMAACPRILLPWRDPVWLQFVSHKAMRLVSPWALLVALVSSGLIGTLFYQTVFVFQLAGLAVSVVGITSRLGARQRLFSAAGSFFLLHVVAWLAFWFWIFGSAENLWGKSSFSLTPLDHSREP